MGEKTKRKSKIAVIFLGLLGIVVLLGALATVKLRSGIELQRFALASVQAERIALRIDNGIIISMERLELPDRRAPFSVFRPDLLISRFNGWSHLFREIRISSIHYRGHVYTLLFRDNLITVSGDDFQLAGDVSYEDDACLLYTSPSQRD